MAKPLLKIQRYFRRKPVRFFSLILLYLTAGSLVLLHSGFVGDSSPAARGGRDSVVASEMGGQASLSDTRGLGIISRVFKETHRSGRRYGPRWMKRVGQARQEMVRRGGDYTSNWNRALKGRNAKDMDDGRGGLHQGCTLNYTDILYYKKYYIVKKKCKQIVKLLKGFTTVHCGLFRHKDEEQ